MHAMCSLTQPAALAERVVCYGGTFAQKLENLALKAVTDDLSTFEFCPAVVFGPPPSRQVLDLFRQVNNDARVLRQASAQGMSSCCNSLSHMFSKCLRKVGLGNPDLDVENIEFNQRDPLDSTVPKATTSTAVGEKKESTASHRRHSTSQAANAAIEEEAEDEEDEEHDTKEIHEQVRRENRLWINAACFRPDALWKGSVCLCIGFNSHAYLFLP